MSNARRSPTAIRRSLGTQLRKRRLAKALTVEKASAQAGISQSKLSMIELGRQAATRDELLALLHAYGGASDEEQEDLLALVRDGRLREWWESIHALHPKFGTYLGLEAVAAKVEAYDATLVHGLLQTPDYSREVIRAVRQNLLPHEVDELVEARARRQHEVFSREDQPPLELWSIMDEAALRREVGGPATMHAQLERLIEASALPNVTLQVLPFSLGAHPTVDGSLAILEFEDGDRPVVYVESQAGNLYIEKDDGLRRGREIMTRAIAAAAGPDQSRAIIKRIAQEMKPRPPNSRQ